jgi:hypothetical protein
LLLLTLLVVFVQIKMLEANLTGALRREQEAELSTKRFGLEIEHANRLVHKHTLRANSCLDFSNLFGEL